MSLMSWAREFQSQGATLEKALSLLSFSDIMAARYPHNSQCLQQHRGENFQGMRLLIDLESV